MVVLWGFCFCLRWLFGLVVFDWWLFFLVVYMCDWLCVLFCWCFLSWLVVGSCLVVGCWPSVAGGWWSVGCWLVDCWLIGWLFSGFGGVLLVVGSLSVVRCCLSVVGRWLLFVWV